MYTHAQPYRHLSCLTLLLGLAIAPASQAEVVLKLDVYAGMPFSDKADLTLHQYQSNGGFASAQASFDSNSTVATGARARVYLSDIPVGLGMDVSHFRSRGQTDLDITPAAFGLTLFPGCVMAESPAWGKLKPSLMAGFLVPLVDGSISMGGLRSTPDSSDEDQEQEGVGSYLAAGLEWEVTPRFSTFLEYRFQRINMEFRQYNNPVLPTTAMRSDGRLDVSSVALGVSWRLAFDNRPSARALPQTSPAETMPEENGPSGN